jgi:probable F420-dependent oxidoreductase
MQLGISLYPMGPSGDGEAILQVTRKAERLGFDYAIMGSHVLASQLGPEIDPIVALATFAGATSRLRFASTVVVLPYYNPVVLANQAASLDLLSNGRFVLGVGAGWDPAEFAAVGVPLGERGARTDEHLAVMKALWSGEPVDFDGRFTTLRQARLGLSPLTPGGPPIWVGGQSDAALRRALRFADGWNGAGLDHRELAEIKERLARLGDEVGRDPASLELTMVAFLVPPGLDQIRPSPGRLLGGPTPTADSLLEELWSLQAAGISMCALWMPIGATQVGAALDWVAAEIMPRLDQPRVTSAAV